MMFVPAEVRTVLLSRRWTLLCFWLSRDSIACMCIASAGSLLPRLSCIQVDQLHVNSVASDNAKLVRLQHFAVQLRPGQTVAWLLLMLLSQELLLEC